MRQTAIRVSVTAVAITLMALSGLPSQAAKPEPTPSNGTSQGNSSSNNNDASSKTSSSSRKTPISTPSPEALPIQATKGIEVSKPSNPSVDYVNAPSDNRGAPVANEGLASFGNPKKLTASEKQTAAAEKAAAKEAAGDKLTYIVRFNESANLTNEIAALKKDKATVGKRFNHVMKGLVVGLTDKQKATLAKRATVESITEDGEVTATDTQVNPGSWGLDRIDQANLPLSASYTYGSTGTGTTIYVVDTGVLSAHVEFTGRVNPGYTAVADGRGTEDCNGHGTHVSSTAAGTNFGVAKLARLTPVRVLGCDGSGSISGVIAGLDWIAGQYVAGTPAVVNMSLGGSANTSLDTAVNSLINRGITVVVAAGNSATDACTSSPARVTNAVTVAATTSSDALASYSNFGSCVDLGAPGSSITGAWISSTSALATLSGTSMASPHAAGVAALFLENGFQQPSVVVLALTDSATKGAITGLPAGTNNALLFANPTGFSVPVAKIPFAPVAISAVAGKRQATVSWTPAENAGLTVISQTIKVWSGGNVVGTVKVAAGATNSVVKLRAGFSYSFTVFVSTAEANSLDSAMSNVVRPTR